MNLDFKTWLEGRRDPEALRTYQRKETQPELFDTGEEKTVARPQFDRCPVTPLSSYDKEIKGIQSYAQANPENFAQVMLFSPLSANVNFGKHWDTFPVLMTILRYIYPNGATKEQLQEALAAFGDKYFSMKASIAGWKYDTITHIWNNRDKLYQQYTNAAKNGDDTGLIAALSQIPGVAPVKAGFMAQLIFGRSGCLDTHNIDIYSKTFPDMKGELNPAAWGKGANDAASMDGVKSYVKTLNNLKKRGIGTKELWDVWVDFVGFMYTALSRQGQGLYAKLDPALNPNDPVYQELKTVINKHRVLEKGKDRNKILGIPTIVGSPEGGGAGATHTIAAKDPAETLKMFAKMKGGHPGEDWARSVTREIDPKTGMPYNKRMGPIPAQLHYFGNAVTPDGQVDASVLKKLFWDRIKQNKPRTDQKTLF